jgi:hypothetical protein
VNTHAGRCANNPEANAAQIAKKAGAAKGGAGGGVFDKTLVASEASKSRLLANCAMPHALFRAVDDDPLSVLTEQLQWQQDLRADVEVRELEDQARKGLHFFSMASLPCQDVLFIVQAVAQIFKGLENVHSSSHQQCRAGACSNCCAGRQL